MVEFNAERHEYRVGGRVIISVTQALRQAGLYDYSNLDPFYAERGQAVHLATELHDKGELDETTVNAEHIAPRLRAYKRFLRENQINIHYIEHKFANAAQGFAGTIDRVLWINGCAGYLDIKAGQPAPWHKVQTAGYVMGNDPRAYRTLYRWALYLKDDGTYKLDPHTDPTDFFVWQSALTIAKWKRRHGYDG